MSSKSPLVSDKYKRNRGGYSRLLKITCGRCEAVICLYQKDGHGSLCRMYLDRMRESPWSEYQDGPFKKIPNLVCDCGQIIAVPMIYEKEDRFAYRLFEGAVHKKIVKNPKKVK